MNSEQHTQTSATDEQLALIQLWYKTQQELNAVKAEEMILRKQVESAGLFDPEKTEGTEYFNLPNNWRLKITKKLDFKLKNDLGQTDKALENISDDTMAEMLVKWTPTLSVSTYKKLTPELQAVFNECLEIKTASSSLEVIAPKP